MMQDEFSSDGYSLDSFFVAATDSRGHASKSRLNVPPAMQGELASLIASRQIPAYRTTEDFWRDAGVHRLHYLRNNNILIGPEWQRVANALEAESRIERYNRVVEADNRLYNEASRILNGPRYVETLDLARGIVKDITDSTLRQRLADMIERYT